MKQRLAHIDYLRSVYIILMVIFHLAYIGDKYPYAKLLVYTFHMPAFLIISGYLLNTEKRPATFLKTIGWIFVPYAVMECGYITMSAILPVRQQVESLSAGLFADKLFLHPLGPYWYLHTWMLCSLCCYAVHRLFPRADSLPVGHHPVGSLPLAAVVRRAGVAGQCRLFSAGHGYPSLPDTVYPLLPGQPVCVDTSVSAVSVSGKPGPVHAGRNDDYLPYFQRAAGGLSPVGPLCTAGGSLHRAKHPAHSAVLAHLHDAGQALDSLAGIRCHRTALHPDSYHSGCSRQFRHSLVYG